MSRYRALVAGFYVWMVGVSFGAILLDIIYAHYLYKNSPTTQAVFSEAADFLLWISGLTLITAVGAIASTWSFKAARNLFILSLTILMIEFIFPAIISPFFQHPENLGIGPWLRIIFVGSASVCACIGLMLLTAQNNKLFSVQ